MLILRVILSKNKFVGYWYERGDMNVKKFLYALFKVLLTIVPPIGIGILSAIIDWNNFLVDKNRELFFGLMVLGVIFVIASIIYVFIDAKNITATRKLNKITKINNVMQSHFEGNYDNYIEFRKEAANKQLRFGLWGFDHECRRVCQGILNFFHEFKKEQDILVSIVRKDSMGNYNTIGFSYSPNCNIPPRYSQNDIILNIDTNYKKIFDNMYVTAGIVFSKKNIDIKQKYMFDDTSTTYSEYISVPIYDVTSNNNKIIARLEITSYDKKKIFDNKKDATKYFQYYFSPMIVWLENVYQIEQILRVLK